MEYTTFKRILDIILSFFILFILSPILLVLSLLVIIYNGKPVLFRQVRPGLYERKFTLIKFRTMSNRKDKQGNLLPDSERITKVGAFLRKTSLDELPELWNVLKGEMSLVGPRPLLVEYLPYYSENEKKRHNVRPGITGLSQISGRNKLNWDQRLNLDVFYSENTSFLLDMKILLQTISSVMLSRGVSIDSREVEPSFIEYRGKKNYE